MNQNHQAAIPQAATTKKTHRCPRCKSGTLDRVPRGFIVKYFLGILPLRRYICYKCFKKSYIWHRDGE